MKQLISVKGSSLAYDLGLENPVAQLSLIEAQHRELDARLKELGRRPYLTPNEQVEAAEIKKRKLLAKDQIATLRRVL